MENWIILISFTYPHEAHLAKNYLESYGIDINIKDENLSQVNNFYSTAIGGVKLLVKPSDYEYSKEILVIGGYIKEAPITNNRILSSSDKLTKNIPFIGNIPLQLRLFILIATFLIITSVTVFLLSIPTKSETLINNNWCVEKVYYNGKEISPKSTDVFIIIGNCTESINFRNDGRVLLPGFDSPQEILNWNLEKKKLIISTQSKLSEQQIISEKKDSIRSNSIYSGNYNLEIKNNLLFLKSEDLEINCRTNNLNFWF